MWALHGTWQCRCFHATLPSRPSIRLRPICTSGGSATSQQHDACVVSSAESHISRRQLALSAVFLSATASVHPPRAATATESQAKRKHLRIEELKDIIAVSNLLATHAQPQFIYLCLLRSSSSMHACMFMYTSVFKCVVIVAGRFPREAVLHHRKIDKGCL